MANWAATVVAAIALIVSVINMVLQNRLGSAQKELAGKQVALSLDAPRKCVLSASRDARMPF